MWPWLALLIPIALIALGLIGDDPAGGIVWGAVLAVGIEAFLVLYARRLKARR